MKTFIIGLILLVIAGGCARFTLWDVTKFVRCRMCRNNP